MPDAPEKPYPLREVLPVCCDCRKQLRPGDPRVSNGKTWRCAACEYERQRRGGS